MGVTGGAADTASGQGSTERMGTRISAARRSAVDTMLRPRCGEPLLKTMLMMNRSADAKSLRRREDDAKLLDRLVLMFPPLRVVLVDPARAVVIEWRVCGNALGIAVWIIAHRHYWQSIIVMAHHKRPCTSAWPQRLSTIRSPVSERCGKPPKWAFVQLEGVFEKEMDLGGLEPPTF